MFDLLQIPTEIGLISDNVGAPVAFTEIAVFSAKPVSFDANDKCLRVACTILSQAVSKFMTEWKDEFAFFKPVLAIAPAKDSERAYRTKIYAKIYWVDKKYLEERCQTNISLRKTS